MYVDFINNDQIEKKTIGYKCENINLLITIKYFCELEKKRPGEPIVAQFKIALYML